MSAELHKESAFSYGPPTILGLFRYSPDQLGSFRRLSSLLGSHLQEISNSRNHRQIKELEAESIIDKLSQLVLETQDQKLQLLSSVSVGKAYLKFLDDFLPQGYSPDQILHFFEVCLTMNTRRSKAFMETFMATKQTSAAMGRVNSADFNRKYILPLLMNLSHQDPFNFKGNNTLRYANYFIKYGDFQRIVNPETFGKNNLEVAKFNKLNQDAFTQTGRFTTIIYGYTSDDGMPDWLLDKDGSPKRDNVEEELKEDQMAYDEIGEQITHHLQKSIYLNRTFAEKRDKFNKWLQEKWLIIWPQRPTLGDLLLYLHHNQDPEDLNKAISTFTQSPDRLSDSQTLSLFIENVIQTAGLIKNGTFDINAVNLFKEYLLTVRTDATDVDRINFRKFREENKNGYNALNFDLGGFIRQLSGEDHALFEEFLDESQQDASSVIEFLADLLGRKLKEVPEEYFTTQPAKASYERYREFLGKFLRANWNFCFEKFYTQLYPVSDQVELASYFEQASSPTSEFEQELDDFDKDMTDWEFYYAIDLARPEEHLIGVEGETLSNKSSFLRHFLSQYGISCSIKPESVIATLYWKTSYPEEHEALIPTKTVEGQTWKKIKRGAVRIFYKRDSLRKRLTFNIHQKKAWTYGF